MPDQEYVFTDCAAIGKGWALSTSINYFDDDGDEIA
jgi:hypothetical protein